MGFSLVRFCLLALETNKMKKEKNQSNIHLKLLHVAYLCLSLSNSQGANSWRLTVKECHTYFLLRAACIWLWWMGCLPQQCMGLCTISWWSFFKNISSPLVRKAPRWLRVAQVSQVTVLGTVFMSNTLMSEALLTFKGLILLESPTCRDNKLPTSKGAFHGHKPTNPEARSPRATFSIFPNHPSTKN